jgi:anti-anti-sigma regulatory factor
MADVGTIRVFRPDPSAAEEPGRRGGAVFTVRNPSPTLSVVAVSGVIDALNGRDLGRFAERHTGMSNQLIVDLGAVEFFGTQGFTALHYISVNCTRLDVDWVIVAGAEVRRLLRICDPEGELPLVDSCAAAHTRLERLLRRPNVAWAG